ncbi:unnamed protein product, partial [Mesorhabditis spiculigera]
MGDRTNAFSILQRTRQTLNDLSRFLTGTPELPEPPSFVSLKPVAKRKSREMRATWCPIPSTSGQNPNRRHHSLTSMKTYYAFGARSHSAGSGSRSFNSLNLDTYGSDYGRRSFSTRSYGYGYVPPISVSTRMQASYPSERQILEDPSALISKYCRSPTISSIPTTRSSGHPLQLFPRIPSLAVTKNRHQISAISELKEVKEKTPEVSRRTESYLELRDSPNLLSPPLKTDRATSASLEILPQTDEVDDLKRQNRFLEEEVARLKLLLKEKERIEHEIKRKLLEVEAEAKVWRNKCEHLQPKVIQITEPSIDQELLEKLDSATDKLTKLNFAHDMKMLQSQMETALHEMSS